MAALLVPESTPLVKVMPAGSVPETCDKTGAGRPEAVTGKLLATPCVKVMVLALVNAGTLAT